MSEFNPFGADAEEAPAQVEAVEEAASRKKVVLIGALAAVLVGAGAFLFLGGGADEEVVEATAVTLAPRAGSGALGPRRRPRRSCRSRRRSPSAATRSARCTSSRRGVVRPPPTTSGTTTTPTSPGTGTGTTTTPVVIVDSGSGTSTHPTHRWQHTAAAGAAAAGSRLGRPEHGRPQGRRCRQGRREPDRHLRLRRQDGHWCPRRRHGRQAAGHLPAAGRDRLAGSRTCSSATARRSRCTSVRRWSCSSARVPRRGPGSPSRGRVVLSGTLAACCAG